MTRLPSLKPKKVVAALKKIGFVESRQTGSHLIMTHQETGKIVPVPMHTRELKRGLLTVIIKEANLTREEFLKLLR